MYIQCSHVNKTFCLISNSSIAATTIDIIPIISTIMYLGTIHIIIIYKYLHCVPDLNHASAYRMTAVYTIIYDEEFNYNML